MTDIDFLAAVIRDVDPQHTLGAGALAEALIGEGVRVPTPTCGDETGLVGLDHATCVLPPGHTGWHASAPSWTAEGGTRPGGTWTPQYAGSDGRLSR